MYFDADVNTPLLSLPDKETSTQPDTPLTSLPDQATSEAGHDVSGTLHLYFLPGFNDGLHPLHSDLDTDGGGWIVLQRRQDGSDQAISDTARLE